MRYVDEFRSPAAIRAASEAIAATVTRRWTIMEICGGQTHAIMRWSLPELLPEQVELVHGPGCPVCVTPAEVVEQARQIALQPDVILASFGDMLRVPGTRGDLLAARAEGADVRVVTSPLDALALARAHADRTVVLFAVGFETTAPATAMAIELAAATGLGNFAALTGHVRVAPAIELLLAAPDNRVQGLLAAGHVCTVEGVAEYPPLVERFAVPVVVAGFEPLDILSGLLACVRQLESGAARLEIDYRRAVRPEGNPRARACVERVFEIVDAPWRGLGVVPAGGLRIRDALAELDAGRRFSVTIPGADELASRCRAAEVLRGILRPSECPEFGRACTPERPLGAPMVSSEGACAAYFRHRGRPS
ncbi:MAG TPA: hydrogenase formation protein HypD [Enhygromyxa sp.]|nr:hydrogenase formation protein HypD [Enhygromyxa sp.]